MIATVEPKATNQVEIRRKEPIVMVIAAKHPAVHEDRAQCSGYNRTAPNPSLDTARFWRLKLAQCSRAWENVKEIFSLHEAIT
jgi:hypothetical protein